MVKKKRIAIVLGVWRRNSAPAFCAMVPQEEKQDDAGWTEPAGFHLIPLPFADDIRTAAIEKAATGKQPASGYARDLTSS